MSGCEARIELDRATKLGRGFSQIPQLSFDHTQFQMDVSRGLQAKGQLQFVLSICEIVLL